VKYTVTLDATASLSANPTTTGAGQPVTLTWTSTHAQSCTATGDWSGTLPSTGSQSVTPTTLGIHNYGISCSNPGAAAQASQTVTAVSPVLSFSAFPANVQLGKKTTLRWQGQYATGCIASGAWSGPLSASGFQTRTLTAQGITNYHLVCSNAAASDQKDASITVGAAPSLPAPRPYRMNEVHDGVLITSNGATYPSQSAPTWTRNLGAPASYPLIVNGMVFVATANADSSYGNQLYALDEQTGAIVWGPVAVAGVYFGSGLTYENGRVFLLMFDGGLHAFNASNGASLWTTQLPGYWYEASPNAYGGIVYVSGNAGLSAVDETNGYDSLERIEWSDDRLGFAGGVVGRRVFAGRLQLSVQGEYDPMNGTTLWQTKSACNSPWGYASVVKNGIFFGRVGNSLDLFDATAGISKASLLQVVRQP